MAVTCGGGEHSVKSHVVHGEHVRIQLVHSSSTPVHLCHLQQCTRANTLVPSMCSVYNTTHYMLGGAIS